MRMHQRNHIRRTRHACNGPAPGAAMEDMAGEVIRLARIATALHLANQVETTESRRHEPSETAKLGRVHP